MNELPLRAGVSSPASRALSNSKYMPVVALTELPGFVLRANGRILAHDPRDRARRGGESQSLFSVSYR